MVVKSSTVILVKDMVFSLQMTHRTVQEDLCQSVSLSIVFRHLFFLAFISSLVNMNFAHFKNFLTLERALHYLTLEFV